MVGRLHCFTDAKGERVSDWFVPGMAFEAVLWSVFAPNMMCTAANDDLAGNDQV